MAPYNIVVLNLDPELGPLSYLQMCTATDGCCTLFYLQAYYKLSQRISYGIVCKIQKILRVGVVDFNSFVVVVVEGAGGTFHPETTIEELFLNCATGREQDNDI